MEYLK
jgi:hypothetical protein